MGDNVVWSVADLENFKFFAIPFAEQAIRDGRNLIYMRFADHEPLLTPRPGLKICEFDPDKGFEAFTVDIHDRIAEEGRDAFYVFDSLSSLQSVWYTDLMMGNFFRVTCPYLFQLDTVAYFPLLRGRHSFEAVARIRDTTQLLLDVYRGDRIYLHPLKVWNRYSTRMFLPHSCSLQQGDRKTDHREYADKRPETAGNDQDILQTERLFPAPGPYGRQWFPWRKSMRHAPCPEDHTYGASGVQEIF